MNAWIIINLVLLLVITNGAPVLASLLLKQRFNQPLDYNLQFIDGRPLLGAAKTVRGIISAILLTTLMAPLFGLSPAQGSLFALLAMSGDLPETLLPLWVMHPFLNETIPEACAAILVFVVIDWFASMQREPVNNDASDAG